MSISTIRAGDHLWVRRLGYIHHGIASGPGSVIHYRDKDRIAKTTLNDFAEGSAAHITDHPHRRHDRGESVRRARQRIGEADYSLVFNNCEHFVTWCIDGDSSSEQVASALHSSGGLLAGALAAHAYRQKAETIRHAASLAQAITTARHSISAANAISAMASGGAAAGFIAGGTGIAAGVAAAPVAVPVAIGVAAVAGLWSALFD